MGDVLCIKDWADHFENNRTRELKQLGWVPVPNKMDGDGYTELLDHPNGAAHYGAWHAIVKVASRCDPRGTLLRDGARPHNSGSLSRITRIPEAVFDEAIPRLINIGWLHSVPIANKGLKERSQDGAGLPQEGAAKSQEGALNGMEGNGREGKGKHTSADADGPPLPGFDRWWSLYPKSTTRKTSKSKCRRIWRRNRLEAIAEQVIAGLLRCKASKDWLDGFFPMTTTFLNQGMWENEGGAEDDSRDPTPEELEVALGGGES